MEVMQLQIMLHLLLHGTYQKDDMYDMHGGLFDERERMLRNYRQLKNFHRIEKLQKKYEDWMNLKHEI